MKRFKHLLLFFLIICLGLFMLGGCKSKNSSSSSQRETSQTQLVTEEATESSGPLETAESPDTESSVSESHTEERDTEGEALIDEDGEYTSKDDVALYIHTYGKLPSNFITKEKAQDAGWNSKKGNLGDVLPGKSIGGDRFGNYEGLLPKASSRKYFECDIDYDGGRRSAKRIVYSNDGLVFYTDDHYKSFTQLY